jgi:hypothetical protein
MADEITIDIDKLTLDDLAEFEAGMSVQKMREILNRVVKGGAKGMPVTRLRAVMEALLQQAKEAMNPKGEAST